MSFFNRKEKEAEELFLKHCDKVMEALNHLHDLVAEYLKCDKEFKAESLKVHQSENEADIVKQEIECLLYEGAFLPINRGDYILLAEFIDRIANQCEQVANLVVLTRLVIPDFLNEDILALLEKGRLAVGSFRKAMEAVNGDVEALKATIQEVLVFEGEGDRIEWDTIKKIFKSDLDLARKLHLRELIMAIGEIADLAEDASERLGIMLVKRPL
ncbi:MAG TPA: TIGR00153 family protein [bacterium]|nr:TIGR00153 family protein [bacterium]HPQ65787.1 TIGR00153 family protein [bacterium]